jgi:hypothetical protein
MTEFVYKVRIWRSDFKRGVIMKSNKELSLHLAGAIYRVLLLTFPYYHPCCEVTEAAVRV